MVSFFSPVSRSAASLPNVTCLSLSVINRDLSDHFEIYSFAIEVAVGTSLGAIMLAIACFWYISIVGDGE